VGLDQAILLDAAEAAALLRISPKTLAVWRATGRVKQPPYIKIGRAVRYRRTDLDEYVAANRHGDVRAGGDFGGQS